ncbi:hypothetical protein ASD13_16985 [Microbacterium sp. Root1433D1]|uniref:hypothetical protein n=1 Tax=Microbacterium sp. Root1433D1 TaxID=1736463 RepID=UPI000700B5A8|nr:hypothetical protein [Microbacterium sp. Root1433D1]KQY73812.1 hypothetical protein ASD13_16985 [Microbacterium sp. Root1433D1]
MNLDAYVSSLPPARRQLFTLLSARAARLAAERVDIQDFVFVPGHPHPTWEDGAAVMWRAIEQLMLVSPAGADELPIIWIGYDVALPFRKRDAQGFLLTDRRLIAKDSTDLVFSKGEERQYPLYVGPNGIASTAATIASAAIGRYDWAGAGSLVDAEDAEWFSQLLVAAMTMTLEVLASSGAEIAEEPATSQDVRGRVKELGLGSDVKYADDKKHAKHFARFSKKMPLDAGEQIVASFSDGTLAGVYGLMLTDRNIRSRDLMEEPTSTPRSQVDAAVVRVSPESTHKIIVAPGEVHDVPSHMSEAGVAALVTLIQEWAGQRIS